MKTAPLPFFPTVACLDIKGQECNYRINISCDTMPNEAIFDEGTEILRQLGEALNQIADEGENCHEHGNGCSCDSGKQPESQD